MLEPTGILKGEAKKVIAALPQNAKIPADSEAANRLLRQHTNLNVFLVLALPLDPQPAHFARSTFQPNPDPPEISFLTHLVRFPSGLSRTSSPDLSVEPTSAHTKFTLIYNGSRGFWANLLAHFSTLCDKCRYNRH